MSAPYFLALYFPVNTFGLFLLFRYTATFYLLCDYKLACKKCCFFVIMFYVALLTLTHNVKIFKNCDSYFLTFLVWNVFFRVLVFETFKNCGVYDSYCAPAHIVNRLFHYLYCSVINTSILHGNFSGIFLIILLYPYKIATDIKF